jgi:hypothetical protein
LNFIYLSNYKSHNDDTLNWLQQALDEFHEAKGIFIELEQRKHFNFLKLHVLQHYIDMICEMGMLDGYNTKQSERMHIDVAKKAYQASNKKEYFAQMTMWLEQYEILEWYDGYLHWVEKGEIGRRYNSYSDNDTHDTHDTLKTLTTDSPFVRIQVSHTPSFTGVTPEQLSVCHGALDFIQHLNTFLKNLNPPPAYFPNDRDVFQVYKKAVIHLPSIHGFGPPTHEIIRATPSYERKSWKGVQQQRGQFEVVLVHETAEADTVGLQGA